MKTGIELIAAERQEQIEKHHRTIDHDVECNDLEIGDGLFPLAHAAIAVIEGDDMNMPPFWTDVALNKKMCGKPYQDRLIIAGALIAAEIDRLQA